jgi:hypothetical protein
VSKIKALVSEIRDLKLTKPEMSSGPSKSSDAMKAAMAEAKEAVATHGATSTEAVLAWVRYVMVVWLELDLHDYCTLPGSICCFICVL